MNPRFLRARVTEFTNPRNPSSHHLVGSRIGRVMRWQRSAVPGACLAAAAATQRWKPPWAAGCPEDMG